MIERIKTVIIVILLSALLAACGTAIMVKAATPSGGDYALNNENQLFQTAARAVGWHQPRWSQEIANHLIRNMRYNDPGHKSYVYIYANNGAIKAYFPVIGKCSATDSSPTSLWHAQPSSGNNDTTNNNSFGGNDNTGVAVDSPQLDGSYGANEPGIFCFVDKPGHPMITFNGDYIMSDQYIPLHQAPELIVDQTRSGVKR